MVCFIVAADFLCISTFHFCLSVLLGVLLHAYSNMHVHVCAYMCTHAYILCQHIHCTCTHMHIHSYTHMHTTRTHTHACTHTRMHAYTHARTHIHTHTHTCTDAQTIHVCTYMWIQTISIVHTHALTQIWHVTGTIVVAFVYIHNHDEHCSIV